MLSIARDMPRIALDDALRILYLMREHPSYDRAAVRFLVRIGGEVRDIDPEGMQRAAAAVDALPDRPELSMAQLAALIGVAA